MSTQQELVKIDIQPALVEINYQEVKSQLREHLRQYDVVVTAETLKESKELATNINKQRQAMKKRFKEAIAKASAPIQDLESKVNELDAMQEEVRQKLLRQVAVYEDETRQAAERMLITLRAELWDKHDIEGPYRTASIKDLIKISSVTDKGNLTKAARDTLGARVNEDKALQDQTTIRLLELENRSYRAGLTAPLAREHVVAFLWAPPEQYEAKLQALLDAEVKRQEEINRQMRLKHANEQADLAEAQPKEEPAEKSAEELPMEPPERDPDQDGKVARRVVATFEVQVDQRVKSEDIEAELRKRLKDADISTLTSIEVT